MQKNRKKSCKTKVNFHKSSADIEANQKNIPVLQIKLGKIKSGNTDGQYNLNQLKKIDQTNFIK